MFLAQMLVVHLVCPPNCTQIDVVRFPKQLEALVNEDLVDEKVSQAINSNSEPDPNTNVIARHHTRHDEQPTRDRENQEKRIVFLEESWLLLVVIFVQIPAKTMHHIFMCEPRHEFHKEKRGDDGTDVENEIHIKASN